MKILGLDSSGIVASVAVVEDDILVAEYTVNYKKTHSQTLLPMLDEIAKMTELDLNTIDAIAVAAGPGSFTGLRIGSATAKGLGLALKKPLVAVPTVEGPLWNRGTDLPDHGCKKKTGLHRNLSFRGSQTCDSRRPDGSADGRTDHEAECIPAAGDLPGRRRTGFQGHDRRETDCAVHICTGTRK